MHGLVVLKAKVSITDTRACYFGPGMRLAPHRNSVATVVKSLDGTFGIRMEGVSIERSAVLVPPNTLHHVISTGPMLFLYLDALSDDFQSIRRVDLEQVNFDLSWEFVCADRLMLDLGIPTKIPESGLFEDCVRRLSREPQHFERVEQLAELTGLSVSRFQAVFREQMGIPFRRYRLWSKLRLVARRLSAGLSLTAAAHDSGFSSSAHLSSAFKEMFGLAPSDMLRLGVEFLIQEPV